MSLGKTSITSNSFSENLAIISNGIFLTGVRDLEVSNNKFSSNGV